MKEEISENDVLKRFPEARKNYSNKDGHVEWNVHCPFGHKKGGYYKLSINATTGAYKCWDCGKTGNAFVDFFRFRGFSGMGHLEVSRPPEQAPDGSARTARYVEHKWGECPAPGADCIRVAEIPDPHHPVLEYLRSRGFSREFLNSMLPAHDLWYCRSGAQFRFAKMGTTNGRIIFPVFSNGVISGWQARQIESNLKKDDGSIWRHIWHGESEGWCHVGHDADGKPLDKDVPKYYTCPAMQASRLIYNFDAALKMSPQIVVVCEGPMSAVKVGAAGVATFGKRISETQMRMVKSNWPIVVLLIEPDALEGSEQKRMKYQQMLAQFADGCQRFEAFSLDGYKDAGDAPTEEVWRQIKEKLNKKTI